jgi:hypothetical protein
MPLLLAAEQQRGLRCCTTAFYAALQSSSGFRCCTTAFYAAAALQRGLHTTAWNAAHAAASVRKRPAAERRSATFHKFH